jgi:hypothetical protein
MQSSSQKQKFCTRCFHIFVSFEYNGPDLWWACNDVHAMFVWKFSVYLVWETKLMIAILKVIYQFWIALPGEVDHGESIAVVKNLNHVKSSIHRQKLVTTLKNVMGAQNLTFRKSLSLSYIHQWLKFGDVSHVTSPTCAPCALGFRVLARSASFILKLC